MYYSFYLDVKKTMLVYRTEDITTRLDGMSEPVILKQYSPTINDMFEPESTTPKQFSTEAECKQDFYKLLWDNEYYRFGEIFGLKPEKKVSTKIKSPVISSAPITLVEIPKPIYHDLPQRNTVYNEDCLLTMSRMPDGFVDHIITSPPYNVGKRVSCGKNNAIYIGDENMYSEGYGDELNAEQYEEWLFQVIRECIRVTKYHVFFNIQMLSKNKRTVLKIHGEFCDYIKDKLIWNKSIAAPNIVPGIMRSAYEDIFIFSNDNPESRDFKDGEFSGSFSNVLSGVNASQNKHRKLNKATFPLYLPRTILNHWGEKGQLVYDPFNGTGTTGDACVIEKRDYIGSELDPLQCAASNQRIKDRTAAKEFDFG